LPEVDAFIGLDQITRVAPIIEEIFARERGSKVPPASFVTPRSTFIPDYDTPRFRLTPAHFAYVKIAEGCNHPCTFCIIPQIRGRHRSRTVASVAAEVRQLVAEGVKEVNLISQDTTFFGMDTWDERPSPRTPVDSTRGAALTSLLRELNAIEGDFWIRILYTHPAALERRADPHDRRMPEGGALRGHAPAAHQRPDALGDAAGDGGRVHPRPCRPHSRGDPRHRAKDDVHRGLSGETEADVDELCDFIREARF